MVLELTVDRIRCDGAGLCAELLPELVRLDDWGYPILRPGEVPPELFEHARRAVDVCPVLALRLAPPRRRSGRGAGRAADRSAADRRAVDRRAGAVPGTAVGPRYDGGRQLR